ncbi:MAG: topoisomerase DNA-binding C4 zinc finger domain-containing protein [Coriobacteriales bacterium]|nr:topoisomerase DNA-binding C4 zinc finger domain-containing protein [Coriobacteriales bacterium]
MQLVITEKNDAAKRIAELLAEGRAKADKVYDTPVYRFSRGGEDWVTIGLRGHILEVDFVPSLSYSKRRGWFGVDANGEIIPAELPATLPRPPFKKRKPFSEDSVDLKTWKIEGLPYLVFGPLEKLPAEKGIIRSMRSLAGKAQSVIIATDFDREGELIGADALGVVLNANPALSARRARYSSFTKEEILGAFANLTELDTNLAQAGECRQWIDLIWGAVLTRYLTRVRFSGIGNVRPSGRVQTPTLALVVQREEQRNAFVPEDYWVLKATLDGSPDAPTSSTAEPAPARDAAAGAAAAPAAPAADSATRFEATHATERFKDEAAANAAYAAVQKATRATITAVEKKSRKVPPPAPFNTTSLQAAAAAEGLSPARTMRIAESLYMAGYISYPRVDNTVYPDTLDLRATAAELKGNPAFAPYIAGLLAKPGALTATRGKTFTTDHPPIYPTQAANPEQLKPEEWKLYNLIARRFLATLGSAATMEGTKVTANIAGEPFVAKGDVLATPGFRAIYPYGLKKDEQLPALIQGQEVAFLGATLAKKQTEPPSRYSAGRLIQEMEKRGLGTKSTRHSIIERLTEVRYVQNDPVEPTQLGIAVIKALGEWAPHITTPDMTAELEGEMNAIAEGASTRDRVVGHSRALLANVMAELIPRKEEVGGALADAVVADARVGKCPKCGADLLLKSSAKTRSNFIGCSAWPECDVTYPVPQGKIEAVEEPCPACGKPQIKVIQFRQKPLTRCVDPACPSNQEPEIPLGPCPTCAAEGREGTIIGQRSPRTLKRFARCTNYEQCKTSYPLPQRGTLTATGVACEACGAPKATIATRRGPWEICPNPQCPLNIQAAEEKAAKAAAGGKPRAARKPQARKSTAANKPARKKPAATG